ncbi:MAG: putative outer membrane repeat protein [Akkermansiaceae bacterium]|jgi:predicted outer membrane repeat protein
MKFQLSSQFLGRLKRMALVISSALATPLTADQIVTTSDFSGEGSLSAALQTASEGESILFDPSLSGATIVMNSPLTFSEDVIIDATGLADPITIDATGFFWTTDVPNGRTIAIKGVNLRALPFKAYGDLTLQGCQVFEATSQAWGAVTVRGTLTITDCLFRDNRVRSSNGGGGAITLESAGALEISGCTFLDNFSLGNGGAIQASAGSTLSIESSTFTQNFSNQTGGAIYSMTPFSLNHVTIIGNSSRSGLGGIETDQLAQNISNCVVANNPEPDTPGLSLAIVATPEANWIGGIPKLAPLGYYGGPTPTMPPLPISPVIGQLPPSLLATDQRGAARLATGPTDFGAVQSGLLPDLEPFLIENPVVRKANDYIQAPIDPNALCLREAVAFADPGSTITFEPGFDSTRTEDLEINADRFLYVNAKKTTTISPQTAQLAVGEITILEDLHIDGANALGNVSIDGRWESRIFRVSKGVNFTLSNLTLERGGVSRGSGGAISNEGNLIIERCRFRENFTYGNVATIWSGKDSELSITGSDFISNASAPSSPSSGLESIILSMGDLQITSSSFYLNSGGPIIQCSGNTGINQITATTNSDGIKAVSGDLNLSFSTFVGNENPSLIIENAIASLNSSIFSENSDVLTQAFLDSLEGDDLSILSTNPLLSPIGYFGGPTLTMPPLANSPAIDQSSTPTLPTDQREAPRTVGIATDLGATEYGAIPENEISPTPDPVVTISGDRLDISQVNTDNGISFREAIALATPGSQITFSPQLNALEAPLLLGPIRITKPLTVRGPDLPQTISLSHSFLLRTNETVIFEDLNRIGGDSYFIRSEVPDCSLELRQVNLSNSNKGILLRGSLAVSGCLFEENDTARFSNEPVISVTGHVEINSSIFKANTGYGPVVSIEGELQMIGSQMEDNENNFGTLEVNSGNVTIEDSSFSRNAVQNASVAKVVAPANGGSILVTNTSFVDNTAQSVSACLQLSGESIIISRSTISGNQVLGRSSSLSSGIDLITEGEHLIERVTFTQNSGGPPIRSEATSATLSVVHCTMTGNTSSDSMIYNGSQLRIQNSIIADNDFRSSSQITSPSRFEDLGGNYYDSFPLLRPLGDYGGPTLTMPPRENSPVIDLAVASNSRVDQTGFAIPEGEAADAGAVEFHAVFVTDNPYSFTLDLDSDGLPEALEVALGRNPEVPDYDSPKDLRILADGSVTLGSNFEAREWLIIDILGSKDLQHFDTVLASNETTAFPRSEGLAKIPQLIDFSSEFRYFRIRVRPRN